MNEDCPKEPSSERNKAHNSQDTNWILVLYFFFLQPPSHLFWALMPWLRVSTWTPELAVRINHSPNSRIPGPWGMPISHLGLSPRSSSTSSWAAEDWSWGEDRQFWKDEEYSYTSCNFPLFAECFRLSLLWYAVMCTVLIFLCDYCKLNCLLSLPALSCLCFILLLLFLKIVGVSASSLLPVNSGNDLAFKLFYLGFFISPILPPFSDFFFLNAQVSSTKYRHLLLLYP